MIKFLAIAYLGFSIGGVIGELGKILSQLSLLSCVLILVEILGWLDCDIGIIMHVLVIVMLSWHRHQVSFLSLFIILKGMDRVEIDLLLIDLLLVPSIFLLDIVNFRLL